LVDLKGICPAIITPFTAKSAVDTDSLSSLANNLVAAGVHGITLFDRISECEKLAPEERILVQRTVVAAINKRVPVIVTVAEDSWDSMANRAREVESEGADAIMLVPPPNPDPDLEIVARQINKFSQAVISPVIVQYSPERMGGVLDADFFLGLQNANPHLGWVRVKTSPAGPLISVLRERSEKRIATFPGDPGIHLIDSLDRGAAGAMTICSLPEIFVRIYEHHVLNELAKSREMQDAVLPLLVDMTQSEEMNIACEKIILTRRRWIAGDLSRPPFFEPDAKHRAELFNEFEILEKYLKPA